jgi:hypothetical protein
MVHYMEKQLTYMKEFDEEVRPNTRDVSTLARTLKSLVYDVLKLNSTLTYVEEEFSNRNESMIKQAKSYEN